MDYIIVLDESLTWSDRISSKYTACARMIRILRRLDGTIRSPAMKRMYIAVIRPSMEYACAVWSGGPTGCLQRLQDSFAKRHSLSLPPLGKRFEYHTLVLFYRDRANLAPTYLSSLVPPITSTNSGHSLTLSQPGGGGGHIVPPPPQVHFLKYLRNALSYGLETF